MPETIAESFEDYLNSVFHPAHAQYLRDNVPHAVEGLMMAYNAGVIFAVTEVLGQVASMETGPVTRAEQLMAEGRRYTRRLLAEAWAGESSDANG